MNSRYTAAALIALAALTPLCAAHADEYASGVAGSSGITSSAPYNNPSAGLGQPTTVLGDGYDASIVYPAYGNDPSGTNTIISLDQTGSVTYTFDTPIVHNAANYYGDDFIVYGNSFFPATSSSFVEPTTNMSDVFINGNGNIYQNGTPVISVSNDGVTFYTLTPTSPWYPTNPYEWVGNSASDPSGFGALNNFDEPVNPDLTLSDFAGQSVAYADDSLYDGSAGGAAFSLAGLLDSDGNPLVVNYIRVQGSATGTDNIDAISLVGLSPTATPEPSSFAASVIGAAMLGLALLRRRRLTRS